tara:strand:+ start:16396 stop:16662 length:267 start_codon:yes stop_codon:yes gene_type:complete
MRIFIFLLLLLCVQANKPRLWTRIPQFYVDNRVQQFINQNRITNCFEYQETETNLLLKCWRDNKLTDVSIEINPGKRNKKFFGVTISI